MKKIALISIATLLGLTASTSSATRILVTESLEKKESVPMMLLGTGTEPLIGGGLHDIIYKQSKETLERWAFTAEAHHIKVTGKKILGGLHGRQKPLTKEELTKYVIDMANVHPELNSSKNLDDLSISYGIVNQINMELILGGLHDYIYKQDLDTVKRWAFTAEAHHNQVTGKKLIGG